MHACELLLARAYIGGITPRSGSNRFSIRAEHFWWGRCGHYGVESWFVLAEDRCGSQKI